MKNKLNLITIMTLIVLLIASGQACATNDEQSIKETVTEFFYAYENKEFSRCLEFFSSRLRSSVGDANLIEEL